MSSPTFGFPSASNNAPPPMFGSNTNPTGGSFGFGGGTNFPNYPIFGNTSSAATTPLSDLGAFSGTTGGMAGLSSGFGSIMSPNQQTNLSNSLGGAYGQGMGNLLYSLLTNGMFNPQVASSFLNAMQPGIAQGQANILNSFGGEGSRFGSAASYGLSNYNAQVNLNEQQTLASLYEQSQQEQLGLLENTLSTIHGEHSNSGILGDVLGGLEIAGSIAAAPFSGGTSLLGIGGGLGTIAGANGVGGGGGNNNNLLGLAAYGSYNNMNSGGLGNISLPTNLPGLGTDPTFVQNVLLQGSASDSMDGADNADALLGLYEG